MELEQAIKENEKGGNKLIDFDEYDKKRKYFRENL